MYLIIIDSGSYKNVVFMEMVEKLGLNTILHPNSFKLCWRQKGNEIKVVSIYSFGRDNIYVGMESPPINLSGVIGHP